VQPRVATAAWRPSRDSSPVCRSGAGRESLDRLITLNNLAACSQYTLKLHDELVADVPSIYQDDPPTQQLMVGRRDRLGVK
jgi:hypothetical protein